MPKLSSLPAETFAQLPILVYHNVHPARALGVTSVHPEVFRRHIAVLLQEGFTPVTFQGLLKAPRFPPKPVVITFDDGYASLMDYAVPILEEYGVPAVVFVVTRFIGKRASWDVHFAGGRLYHLALQELQHLTQLGWEVGSHTATHRALPWLNSTQLQQELAHSRMTLMDMLGQPVDSVAYPFGLVNSRVVRVARKVGYRVGTGSPFWKNAWMGPLALPRIPVFPWYREAQIVRLVNQHTSPWQRGMTAVVRWPAVFTPIYQVLFRPHLWR